jgi:hypothetical protein
LGSVLVALALLAASCGGEEASGTTLAPDVDTVLAAAAAAMGQVESVRFEIERGGAPIYIDPFDTLEFASAVGRFAAPDSADAVVTVRIAGLSTQIGAVALDGDTYLSNPVTGDFEPAPSGYAFDPATLFDPNLGWRPLLTNGLADIEWLGRVELDGAARYRIKGLADQERVAVITAGLVTGQDVVLDMWIDPATGHVTNVEFTTTYRGEENTWALGFEDYGADITIDAPDLDGQG